MKYAVIMAGGTGKRLWPLSRETRPKQVLKLIEGQTLLRRCFDRLTDLFDLRNIIVVTNAGYANIVRENLAELPYNNVIAEPVVRDTAGAIGLAASILAKNDPEATMAVVTADHLIKPVKPFQQAISDAMALVEHKPDALVTFGIDPQFPSTQFGYIKMGAVEENHKGQNKVYKVEKFVEKPDEKTARKYIQEGVYCWNSGMFIWKAKTILKLLFENLPDARIPLERITAAWDTPRQETILEEEFLKLPKISIDFAVMEKAKDVHAIRLKCDWLDMGSFAALADIIDADKNGNVVVADHSELMDCKQDIVITEDGDHLIAVMGLDDVVVAHTPDATLVCHKSQTNRLKELLDQLKAHGRSKFL
jgi:mannose-1-phosphate guanylyltransferase